MKNNKRWFNLNKCPICGCSGENMVFKFYCYNPDCQNFCGKDMKEAADDFSDNDFNFDFIFHQHDGD